MVLQDDDGPLRRRESFGGNLVTSGGFHGRGLDSDGGCAAIFLLEWQLRHGVISSPGFATAALFTS